MSINGVVASGEFGHVVLERFAEELEAAPLIRCKTVCKLWQQTVNALCEDKTFLQKLFTKEGIPLIDGLDRNYYEDLKVLYPSTISGRRICRLLESVTGHTVHLVGKVPQIKEKIFNLFVNSFDPYSKGSMKSNFVFVVTYSEIEILCCETTDLEVDEQGDLINIFPHATEQKLHRVPFSLKNIHVLCSQKKMDNRIFSLCCSHPALNQCGRAWKENRVHLTRKWIVEESKMLLYDGPDSQVAFVQNEGLKYTNLIKFGATSLLVRTVFDAVLIYESGTCPDVAEIYARSLATAHIGNDYYYFAVGGHLPGNGLDITMAHNVSNFHGIVPGALVGHCQPLQLESNAGS